MKRLLIPAGVVAVVVGIAIAATGCGGGGSKSSSAPTSSAGGATVSAQQISGSGNVLVDSKGQALYANDQEKKMALCDGACLSFWMPLTIHDASPKGNSLDGKLGVVTRPGGDKQVTFNGKLLYTFYLDKPGKVDGDGFNDAFGGQKFTWHVVHANGATTSTGNSQPSNTIPGY
jgi:predicted lipoprotein with Yx(FWY)xxD motif